MKPGPQIGKRPECATEAMTDLAYQRFAAPSVNAYHLSLANLLARRDPELWDWFKSDKIRQEAADELRLELLKRTVRLDRDANASVYAIVDEIAEALELDVPATLYQGGGVTRRNATLYFEPSEAHLVFEGDVLERLDEAELRFVIGHELAHHRLWTQDGGKFWAAHRLLAWAIDEAECPPAFNESARLERLYTEVFADRYGLWAVGDLEPALGAQIKLAYDVEDVSAAAYLAQAEEALDAEQGAAARGRTHPESYIRAALLAAWAHDPVVAEGRARTLIESAPEIDNLDLIGQERLADLTHWMLFEFLTDPWGSRDLIRDHAQTISPQLADSLSGARRESEDIDRLRSAIAACSESVRVYLAYLLLDFVTVDPQLDDVMLAAALLFADDFGLSGAFRAIAAKELKTTKTKLAEIEKNAVAILSRAELALGALPPLDSAREPVGGAA